MSTNTKIVVLRSKELVYALVLMVISVLIIMIAVSLFVPQKDAVTAPTQQNEDTDSEESSEISPAVSYLPGIYSSMLQLGSSNVELQIAVDANHINSITMTNLDESVATLYPLMKPTLDELSASILSNQSLEGISYAEDNRYTSMLLMQAITATLDKAIIKESTDLSDTAGFSSQMQ